MVGDHCSRARTTTATVDWLPRPCHVWLQLHRQMVPGPLPLEADGRRKSYACWGGVPSPDTSWSTARAPQKPLDLNPRPENSPQKAWPGPSGVPRSQTPQSWAHSPTTSSFTNASPSTLCPDASESLEKTNSTSHTLRGSGRCWSAQKAAGRVTHQSWALRSLPGTSSGPLVHPGPARGSQRVGVGWGRRQEGL